MLTEWLAATAAVGATIVAVVSIVVGRRGNAEALAAQAEEMRRSRDHERALAHDDRLWHRRSDLYARIVEAVQAQVEQDSPEVNTPQHPTLTRFIAEADVLASPKMRDLIGEFVYNDPPPEEKIDLWVELQSQARLELVGDREPAETDPG